jgi:hypothetical protein
MPEPPLDAKAHAIDGAARRSCMVVIDTPELSALPVACRARLVLAPARLSRLSAEWITGNGARAVIFALFASQPDAWQIGGHLTRTGFRGRVIALSPPLPDLHMVARELRSDFPALRLVVMPVLGH